jgi:hypothetical protein
MPHRQVHFRVTDTEYDFLCRLAAETDESITTTLRRLLRIAMKSQSLCGHPKPATTAHRLNTGQDCPATETLSQAGLDTGVARAILPRGSGPRR